MSGYTGPDKVYIFMRDGATWSADIPDQHTADEWTRLVDEWQGNPAGRCRVNAPNRSVRIEYRDIVRIDFAGGAS